ncbi:hypothetical protein BDN70DRAFT_358420 [Pholiota conissans]|uniref:Uncharacterized protein n=1 Tax=Pholiota conissans TaxID=109636 RepID=A0A9P5ZA97_9AGAR|nr:hypothetical protein BDN70DRAFT_358420 [Pholiota conissans]
MTLCEIYLLYHTSLIFLFIYSEFRGNVHKSSPRHLQFFFFYLCPIYFYHLHRIYLGIVLTKNNFSVIMLHVFC